MAIRHSNSILISFFCCIGCGYSQSPAPSQNKEDLKEVLTQSGYKYASRAFENESMIGASPFLRSYVKYGSAEAEGKWQKADQFDKIELKKTMMAHAAKVKSKVFLISKLPVKVLERGDVEKDGIFVQIRLPLRLRSNKPFSQDIMGYSGSLQKINLSEINLNRFAFLKKDETLQICSYQESQVVLQNDGILYHPEVEYSTLVLNIKDKYDIMKDISKFTKSYIFDLEITNLRSEQPEDWGYYRQKSYKESDMDSEQLQSNVLKTIKVVAPDYFVTHTATQPDPERKSPEIIMATVLAINVRRPDGTLIGSYVNKSK